MLKPKAIALVVGETLFVHLPDGKVIELDCRENYVMVDHRDNVTSASLNGFTPDLDFTK